MRTRRRSTKFSCLSAATSPSIASRIANFLSEQPPEIVGDFGVFPALTNRFGEKANTTRRRILVASHTPNGDAPLGTSHTLVTAAVTRVARACSAVCGCAVGSFSKINHFRRN